ncbi:hypothetical protein [Plantactinospora endophytica]|uniref:Uncharacterized protein n=1 Tax=Plantactinospora endophytica TaxID=673535 RepID=A0ABQ4EF49_9ACTN|nr:hypothetical protein [Plantactinospora endophytica]GIG93351.1 hypothetical protein Pen02_82870 [Plantactinospora endophytica]
MKMYPAPAGLVARFRHISTDPQGTKHVHYETQQVYGFDEDGSPLVVGQTKQATVEGVTVREGRGKLVPADTYANYVDLVESGESPIVAVVPGGGWLHRYTFEGEDGRKYTGDTPVVAWVFRADGDVNAMVSDGDGLVERGEEEIHHPDHPWTVTG